MQTKIASAYMGRTQVIIHRLRNAYVGTFAATSLIQFFGVISGIITARLLGPVGKGEVATVLWLPNLMIAVGLLSLDQAVSHGVSRRPDLVPVLTSTGFWVSLLMGIIQASVLYPLVPVLLGPRNSHLVLIARIMLLHLPVTFSALTLLGVDQGLQNFFRYNLLKLVPSFIYLIFLIILAINGKASFAIVSVLVIVAQLVACIVRAALAVKHLSIDTFPNFYKTGGRLVKQGAAFTLPAIAGVVLMRADLAILVQTVSAERVGYYSVALAIAMGQTGITSSITQVIFPKVASLSYSEAIRSIRIHIKNSWKPILGMAVIVGCASPLIIRYLFGPTFRPALPTSLILVVGIAFWGIAQIIDNGLRAMRLVHPGAIAYSVALLILFALSLLLVSTLKEMGIALALVIAQLAATTILLLFFIRISSNDAAGKSLSVKRDTRT